MCGGSDGKSVCLQCRRPRFNPWVRKIPWRRIRLPTSVFWPGELHGLYSLWGHKGSDANEKLSLSKIQKWKLTIHDKMSVT